MKKFIILCCILCFVGCATTPGRNKSIAEKMVRYSGMAESVTLNYLAMTRKIVGRKNSFLFSDNKATWWANVWDLTDLPLRLHIEWFSPDGRLYKGYDFIATGGYDGIISSALPIKNVIPSGYQGKWKVVVTFRGNLVDSQEFYIGGMEQSSEAFPSNEELRKIFPNFSKADALMLLHEKKVELNKDFSTKTVIKNRIKILTERGKELYSNVQIPFYYGIDFIGINMAHTIKPNGEIIDAEEIRVFSPYENYVTYKASRILSIAMPAVEVGSVIEYEVEIDSSMDKALPNFSENFYFNNLSPALKARFIISCPSELDLEIIKVRFPDDPEVILDTATDKKIYTWEAVNVQSIEIEKMMPSRRETSSSVDVFTSATWRDIALWWKGLSNDRMLLDKELRDKVQDLVKDSSMDRDKIKAIFSFMQSQIRYVQVAFGASPYAPADVVDTFKNRYGDCKDQSALLIAMLRDAGIEEVYFGLTRTKNEGLVNRDVISVKEFNHVVVVVKIDGEYLYLDPTAANLKFGMTPYQIQGNSVFVVSEESYFVTVPYSRPEESSINSNISLVLGQDLKINGELEATYAGQYEWITRDYLEKLEPKLKDEFAHSILLGMYPGANLKQYAIINEYNNQENLRIKISFFISHWLQRVGDVYLLKFNAEDMAQPPGYLGIDRKHPVIVSFRDMNKANIEFELPEGAIIQELPDDYSLDSGELRSRITYSHRGNKVAREQLIAHLAAEIPVEKLKEYREACDSLFAEHKKGLVLNFNFKDSELNTQKQDNMQEVVELKNEQVSIHSYSEYYRFLYKTISEAVIKPEGAGGGTVNLAFTLTSDGALESVEILESSVENALLRSAVEDAIRNSAPFPAFPEDIRSEATKRFTMSIEFRHQ